MCPPALQAHLHPRGWLRGHSQDRRSIVWLNGRQGAAPVIFGEKQDSTLLGAVSLEALGMMLDPEN